MVSVKRSTLSLPECLIESCKLTLSFDSADQIQKGIWKFGRNLLLAKFGSERVKYYSMFSLRRRRNQTPVSNVCKVAPISLFWAANGLNNLPEMRFRFPFNLIGKWTMAFLTVQSWRVLKSWYTGGGPEQGFRRWFADVTNRCLVSSVAQATVGYNFNKDWRVYCGARFGFLRVLIFAIWRIFTSRKSWLHGLSYVVLYTHEVFMVDLCLCTIVISAVQEGINLSNSAALSEPSSLQDYRTSSVSNVRSQPGGVLPMMANTGRLRPNGAPFSAFMYMKA